MTKRKIDACLKLSPYVERRHYACRVRLDLWDALKAECARLNCTQGVYLEVALQKVISGGLVRSVDVFSYSPSIRWFEAARHRMEKGGDFFGKSLTDEERSRMVEICSRVISGEVDLNSPEFERLRISGNGGKI